MTNSRALIFIERYIKSDENVIKQCKTPKKRQWRLCDQEQRFHAIWAAKELYEYVKSHPEMNPYNAIENFAHMMDLYSCGNSHTSFAFSVAHDTAYDILDGIILEDRTNLKGGAY